MTEYRQRISKMPPAFQSQARRNLDLYLPRLEQFICTEDAQINALVPEIFASCVVGKLFDPIPPELPYRWFAPGGSIYMGQWVWDTMFVGMAFAPLDEDEIIREAFKNYWHTIDTNPEAPKGSHRFGMVPNFMGAHILRKDGQAWPPVGYSQIPILAWGCLMMYRQTNDRALVEQCLPYLVTFDRWYSAERDVDGDGLIEYGAYKAVNNNSLVQTARFETFDFHPTLDDMKMTPHPERPTEGAYYGNVEGVEQTCFLLMSEQAMIELAREVGQDDLAVRYERIAAQRIQALQQKMWDPKSRFFYSLDRDSDRKIPVRTIQGFLTLACKAATSTQAEDLVKQLRDPKQWWCRYPVPTCAMNDAKFEAQGFWRGDMWPVMTYMVAYGLNLYGYHDAALDLTERMQQLFADQGISEHYDGTTGEALGVEGLGMSCAVWNMIVENVYGLQRDFRTIRVPPNAKGRHLKLGKIEIKYPNDNTVELRSNFDRKMHVVFPETGHTDDVRISCDGRKLAPDKYSVNKSRITVAAEAGKLYQLKI